MEGAVSERRKAFSTAHRSDEDRQVYITASQRASSVIAKAKAEAWQTTCSSLSPKANPKSVYSLLRSIAGSPSSSSFSPNFPNCSSPRQLASVFAAYLRSHFTVSQPKALCSRARGYPSELRRVTCSEESHSSFCSSFSPAEFLATASNLSSSIATGPDQVAYPMLKHLNKSPSLLYKAFLQPLLTYAPPGWFSFLSVTNITTLERLHRAASRAITSCLSPSPIPFLLSEAYLPPLRVTLTHFTVSSYEQAFRLPTSFPISGLARLGVKPRLCRSSWKAFSSTHPLMLPSL